MTGSSINAQSPKPLNGLRVLDFCWMIAGPMTTRILADLGAEVIKVESYTRIDRIREGGPRREDDPHLDAAGVFADCNSNKRSIVLDLNTSRDRDFARELAAISDMVTDNFTGDRMTRWGLGYSDLVKDNPSLIVMSMPVMGTTGPWMRYGAYGNGVSALAGFNMLMGFPERPPVGIGPLYPDFTSPFFGATALFSALHYRNLTGKGQFIDLAQYQASASLLDTEILDYSVNGAVPNQSANRSPHSCPHGAFRCMGDDNWVVVEITADDEWQALCRIMERPDLAADERLQTLAGRKAHEDLIDIELERWTSQRDRWEIMEVLQSGGIAAGVVQTLQDMLEHDTHMAQEHYQKVEHPSGYEFTVHRLPMRINGIAPEASHHPSMGGDDDYVLGELLGLR